MLYESGTNTLADCFSNSTFVLKFASCHEVRGSEIPQRLTFILALWQLHRTNPVQLKPHEIHEHMKIKINKIQKYLSWNWPTTRDLTGIIPVSLFPLFFSPSFGSIFLINQLLNYHWETSIFPYLCLGNLQFPLLYLKPTNLFFNVWKIIKYP